MKKFSVSLIAALLLVSIFSFAASAADRIGDLFNTWAPKLSPEKITLTVSGQPDATGLIGEAYVEAKGIKSGDIRIDSLTAYVKNLQLNSPDQWGTDGKGMRVNGFESAKANLVILESDMNKVIASELAKRGGSFDLKENGKLSDVKVEVTTAGVKATGKIDATASTNSLKAYAAAWLMGVAATEYPIEVSGDVEIKVSERSIWLKNANVSTDNTAVKQKIQDKITEYSTKALYTIPDKFSSASADIKADSVKFADGSITISTKDAPTAISGTTYTYGSSAPDITTGDVTVKSSSDYEPSALNTVATALGLTSSEDIGYLSTTEKTAPQTPSTALENEIKNRNFKITTQIATIKPASDKVGAPVEFNVRTYASSLLGKALSAFKVYIVKNPTTYTASIASVQTAAAGDITEGIIRKADGTEITDGKVPSLVSIWNKDGYKADTEYGLYVAEESSDNTSSSSSGCNAGIGLTALAILAFAFFKKH